MSVVGIMQQGTGQNQPLLHAPGEFLHQLFHVAPQADTQQWKTTAFAPSPEMRRNCFDKQPEEPGDERAIL